MSSPARVALGGRIVSMPSRAACREVHVKHFFVAPEGTCAVCGSRLVIVGYRGRHVRRLDGVHLLVMRDRSCPDPSCPGSHVFSRPYEEHRFALKKDIFGLDVIFEIGERRLQDDLSFREIQALLRARGVRISERAVARALERILALIRCRAGDTPAVRERLRAQGGMIVLIDGVQFDAHSPVLYVVTDVLSHTTLFSERHELRSAEALQGLLERVKAMDVPVLAFVTDKEKGLVPAIQAVFPGVPHQLCQLHFLKRCAEPLERPLTKLGDEVARAAEKLRAIRRQLVRAQPAKSEAEQAEREVAGVLLLAAHAASKACGRAPFEPPALKRHEGMLRAAEAAERAAAKAGGALHSWIGSPAR